MSERELEIVLETAIKIALIGLALIGTEVITYQIGVTI